ncbi:MAG: HIT domain-containing protein [Candidatus Komeilibacteria bacterium]
MNNPLDFYCDQVLSGKTKVNIEYESDNVLAFQHTKPQYMTHIVIIPKKHINSLVDLSTEDQPILMEILNVTRDLAKKINLEKDGAKLITNMGKFQDSPHLHFHLLAGNKIT